MLQQETIAEIIDSQKRYFVSKRTDLARESLRRIPFEEGKATAITGMRRCGKCTLLLQMQKEKNFQEVVYLNFEDIRLSGFSAADFRVLEAELALRGTRTVFFDEIHIMDGWEVCIQNLLADGVKVFITDTSPAVGLQPFVSSMELFPFSFDEYIEFSHQEPSAESFTRYMKIGGIPKIVRNEGTSIMNNILDDIVVRDIAVRQGIREVEALRQLAVYLLSHTTEEIAANQLIGSFGLRSCATIVEFFRYFRESYIIETIPKYSPSARVRSRNPKKIYATDLGLINVAASIPVSNQIKLENLVYIHLRHRFREITYFKEKKIGDCNFVAIEDDKPVCVVQVCWYLSEYNKFLTYQNLAKILSHLGLKEATVVTFDQRQDFPYKGITIHIVPGWSLSKLY